MEATKVQARIALVGACYVAISYLAGTLLRAPLGVDGLATWRPEVALAILLLVFCGLVGLPFVLVALVIEAIRTPVLGANAGFVAVDVIANAAVSVAAASLIRSRMGPGAWGRRPDLVMLGVGALVLPFFPALLDAGFIAETATRPSILLHWIGLAVPIVAIVPFGIKTREWLRDEDRKPLFEHLAQGATPTVQLSQFLLILAGAAYLWVERFRGGAGEVYPLFIPVFWMALSSGLPAASLGVILSSVLVVSTVIFTKASFALNFDTQLATLVMGVASLISGALVSARNRTEDELRHQRAALQRQLAETQVIRRLADAIIALEHETALYQLAAEAIGEQINADGVRILAISSDSLEASEIGGWDAVQLRRKVALDLTGGVFGSLWRWLERERRPILSPADDPAPILQSLRLDPVLHGAPGIQSFLAHPFAFERDQFYVVVAYAAHDGRPEDSDEQFVRAVADQVTIALQKMSLLQERETRSREFAEIGQALLAHTGERFLRNLMLRLSEATGTRCAYVLRVGEGGSEVVACADGGAMLDGAITIPSDEILALGEVACETGAEERFSGLRGRLAFPIDGYASIRLRGTGGETIGALAICDDKPLVEPEHILAILRLFAGRVASEMERSTNERRLREGEARYRRILETAHEGILILDERDRTAYVNAAMASMLGSTPDDMRGHEFSEFVHPDQRGRGDMRSLAGAAQQVDFRFVRRDGSAMWTLLSLTPIISEDGVAQGTLLMATDISERKRMEEELEDRVYERTAELLASNQELEAFCYSISHDLRQPLRAIDGFSRAVIEDAQGLLPEESQEHLGRVRRAANRMSELIDALLALSRLSRAEMHRTTVNLSKLASEILRELAVSDPDRSEGYSVRPGLEAEGDPRLLRIALENLLNNAWKFSARSERPFVEVGSAQFEGKTWIYVRDNGIGFDMAYSAKLFKPFERLHSDQHYYGTGIGLATAARVINRHGGEIRADGEEGVGATFWFTLDGRGVEGGRVPQAAEAR